MAVPPYITVTYDAPLPSDTGAEFDAKAFDTVAKLNPWSTAANDLADYVNDRADEALASALGGDLPAITGQALKFLRVNAGETAAEFAAIPAPVELSPTQVEDDTSTVFGQVSGQRLAQAIEANVSAVFTASYESSEQTITSAGALTLAHSLGSTPKMVNVFLKVVQNTYGAELGYSVGDEVPVNMHTNAAGNASWGQVITYDATNVYVKYGASAGVYKLLRKDTGAIATINTFYWRLIVRAYA